MLVLDLTLTPAVGVDIVRYSQLMQKLGMSEESQQAAGDMADATMTEIMKEFESMGQKSEYVYYNEYGQCL